MGFPRHLHTQFFLNIGIWHAHPNTGGRFPVLKDTSVWLHCEVPSGFDKSTERNRFARQTLRPKTIRPDGQLHGQPYV